MPFLKPKSSIKLTGSLLAISLVVVPNLAFAKEKKNKGKAVEPEVIEVQEEVIASDETVNPEVNPILNQDISKEIVIQKTIETLPQKLNVEITADEINYNEENNYYEAIGHAEAFIPSKKATLYADKITFSSEKSLLEAIGDIRVVEGNNVTYGTYMSFNTTSNEYELTEPKLFVNGLKLKARVAQSTYYDLNKPENKKNKNEIEFIDGVAAFDEPISLFRYGATVGSNYGRDINNYNLHERKVKWQDIEDKSSFKYSAEEIFVDQTRKTNNVRIKGARIWLNDKLSIPSPVHITTTVGEGADTKFKGPVLGTRERIGGFALGPRFFLEKDYGIYSLVPLVQIGNGPKFGAGAIATFNTPGDRTAIMAGYGTLHDRVIGSFHQYLGHTLHVNGLVNQFKRDSIFGLSQVGQLYELASVFKVKLPAVFEERGMRTRIAAGWASDNASLYTGDEEDNLKAERERETLKEHNGFRSEIEASVYTKPVWRMGTEFYNASLRARGQGAFRFYGTGDHLAIARFGPALEARLDNLAFEIDYLFAAVNGESPFLFDQFIDGNQSVVLDGDYKVNKWFSVGTLLTYNLDRSRFVRSEVRTEFGPDDFKLRLSYDTVRNQIDIGFNMIFGDPVKYDNLRVRI